MKPGITTPLIIAHRGASALAPENTLAALEQALDDGAEGVEFDVRITGDGIPVVFHDASLARITGSEVNIADLTLAEAAAVDVGKWFNSSNPEYGRESYSGEGIPTLEEAFDLLSGFRGPIYVELKPAVGKSDLLSAAVAEVLSRYSASHQLIVKSFDFQIVSAVRQACQDVKTAALFEPSIIRLLGKEERIVDVARKASADRLSIHYSLATRELMNKAAGADLPVTIWTVDDLRELRRFTDLGVDSVITNDPRNLLSARIHEAPGLMVESRNSN